MIPLFIPKRCGCAKRQPAFAAYTLVGITLIFWSALADGYPL
jgi:hypothetical protein